MLYTPAMVASLVSIYEICCGMRSVRVKYTTPVTFKQDGEKVSGEFKSPQGTLPFDGGRAAPALALAAVFGAEVALDHQADETRW